MSWFSDDLNPMETLTKAFPFMVRQAHHERKQRLAVRPEPVEGLNQCFPVVLIAQHAGMMARSLMRAGIRAHAIDQFGDADLFPYVNCHVFSKMDDELALQQALDLLAPPDVHHGLIYGSGVDTHPAWVRRFAERRRLLGNSPETLEKVNSPSVFFPLLDRLSIAYPETSNFHPPNPDGWLYKHGCSEGGKGVAFCAQKSLAAMDSRVQNAQYGYFQRHIPGEAMSALFLAYAGQTRVLGFNTLWVEAMPDAPFFFAGAVNRAGLSPIQQNQVGNYIARLATACSLVGLNSLDFVLDDDIVRVLELNPRPSATLMLYDDDFPEGLMQAHIQACRGCIAHEVKVESQVRAFRIVYAPRAIVVPAEFAWPEWCLDRPHAGVRIAGGEPLCTVTTQHCPTIMIPDAASAAILLEQRRQALLAMLKHTDAIH
jgi:predicted ATP-grasp superfamily ATP-dependent carboligase